MLQRDTSVPHSLAMSNTFVVATLMERGFPSPEVAASAARSVVTDRCTFHFAVGLLTEQQRERYFALSSEAAPD